MYIPHSRKAYSGNLLDLCIIDLNFGDCKDFELCQQEGKVMRRNPGIRFIRKIQGKYLFLCLFVNIRENKNAKVQNLHFRFNSEDINLIEKPKSAADLKNSFN